MKKNNPNNENLKAMRFYEFVQKNKTFDKKWETERTKNSQIQEILNHSSKNLNDKPGKPDFIYVNVDKELLIIVELKDNISLHENEENKNNVPKYAVNGIKHYLNCFLKNIKTKIKEDKKINNFNNWKIIGIAVSGDITVTNDHMISTFAIKNKIIEHLNINEILDENDYLSMDSNLETEQIVEKISNASYEINQILRPIKSSDRSIILSALMICLFKKTEDNNNFYNNFHNFTAEDLCNQIPNNLEYILKKEKIDPVKITKFQELLKLILSTDILRKQNSSILKDILNLLKRDVIPCFKQQQSNYGNYDIVGKFYQSFLRYAGIADVKNGIVLTPQHITTLFTELINITTEDVIIDTCCGSGGLLIAGMNKILEKIEGTSFSKEIKEKKKNNVKKNQIIGFETDACLYFLSISNMLFRGDGKSQIYQMDCFSKEAEKEIKNKKPTIGLINPPYSGKGTTPKEIEFLNQLLNYCTRYVIMIAPTSVYSKNEKKEIIIRKAILRKHTLKAIIHMPQDLFQPNASSHTIISVFKTNKPHNDAKVLFYNLENDGFKLSKNKGRSDILNKWSAIKKDFLKKYNNPDSPEAQNDKNLLYLNVGENDEWTLFAHGKTDYNKLSPEDFLKTVKEFVIFQNKKSLGLLEKKYDEISLLEILNSKVVLKKNDNNYEN